jgi:hypothetical protein
MTYHKDHAADSGPMRGRRTLEPNLLSRGARQHDADINTPAGAQARAGVEAAASASQAAVRSEQVERRHDNSTRRTRPPGRWLTPWTVIGWSVAVAFAAAAALFVVACASGDVPSDVLLRLLEALPSPVEVREP